MTIFTSIQIPGRPLSRFNFSFDDSITAAENTNIYNTFLCLFKTTEFSSFAQKIAKVSGGATTTGLLGVLKEKNGYFTTPFLSANSLRSALRKGKMVETNSGSLMVEVRWPLSMLAGVDMPAGYTLNQMITQIRRSPGYQVALANYK
jgi:hypothetical protein